MNELPWPKRAEIKRLLAMGTSYRQIAAAVSCSQNTVGRYAEIWKFEAMCACGRPAGHLAWCRVRLAFSPNRRGWLADQWGKRADSQLAREVDRAYREAAALGHQLGRFVWGSSSTTTIAYALCADCGKSARLNDGDVRRDRIEGTALREVCLTKEERAAQAAANKERREWRNAKRTLVEIHKHLHPRSSRIRASPREQTSRV